MDDRHAVGDGLQHIPRIEDHDAVGACGRHRTLQAGVVLAATETNDVDDSSTQVPEVLGLPTPTPMVMVGGGPAAVSVTVSVPPADATVKLCASAWPCPLTGGCTVPVNVSVEVAGAAICVGAVSDPPQLAASAAARSTASRFIRS